MMPFGIDRDRQLHFLVRAANQNRLRPARGDEAREVWQVGFSVLCQFGGETPRVEKPRPALIVEPHVPPRDSAADPALAVVLARTPPRTHAPPQAPKTCT